MTKTKETKNADANLGCGKLEISAVGTGVLNAQTFNFMGTDVRVVVKDGDPWFVAYDVCAALGISNNRDALRALDADEIGVGNSDTNCGMRSVSIISEAGMYTLALRSRKQSLRLFPFFFQHPANNCFNFNL